MQTVKSRQSLILVSLLIVTSASSSLAQSAGHDQNVGDTFIGAWRLVSLEQPGPDGKLHSCDCGGMLVTTRDGHMAIQVMDRNPSAQEAAPQYSRGGYEASYGTFIVDESTHTFTFHIEGALVHSLIGKDLPRAYEFAGNRLLVKSTRADERWRVIWERYE